MLPVLHTSVWPVLVDGVGLCVLAWVVHSMAWAQADPCEETIQWSDASTLLARGERCYTKTLGPCTRI